MNEPWACHIWQVAMHLRKLSLSVPFVSTQWFLTLFFNALPVCRFPHQSADQTRCPHLESAGGADPSDRSSVSQAETAFRVWDLIFASDPAALFQVLQAWARQTWHVLFMHIYK